MKKAILFARVSTKHQDLERQKELLMPLIKDDGYQDNEIAVIEHKESATKNDIQNRKSIQDMKSLIATEAIESVYVTEISRLGRRNDVLYEVFALLSKEHIGLIVQSPTLIRTINKDGTDNAIGQIVISFMQHLAVSEMKVKTERSKSGIARRKKQGYLTSSKVIFGYKRDEDNKPIIDKENSKIVIEIFRLCLEGYGSGAIKSKVKHLARWDKTPQNSKIVRILRDPTYIGKNPHYPYPRIIDDETFNKASEMLSSRYTLKYKTKFTYYCQKLIYWDGMTLTPSLKDGSYIAKKDDKKYCSVNVDCLDGITRVLACYAFAEITEADNEEQRKSLLEAKEIAKKKIEGINLEIKAIERKITKVEDGYYDGDMDKDTYNFRKGKLKGEMDYLIKEKDSLSLTIMKSDNTLETDNDYMHFDVSFQNLLDITDENRIVEIINKVIKSINLERVGNGWIIRYEYKDLLYNEMKKEEYFEYLKPNMKDIKLIAHRYDEGVGMVVEDWSNSWEKRLLNFKKEKGINQKQYKRPTSSLNPKDE